ncbi:hypothetical protein Pcinc_026071 [Petrolisthes cinctipes]|uniref:Uncharacterized protein n=1 Tax=Petrolisthes cinctipes TaxID=88211 RepID=A0AAE1K8K1_PETCI|nr:hypothetical protein Pcinc_026071 [Petrolisthes cinctipes]
MASISSLLLLVVMVVTGLSSALPSHYSHQPYVIYIDNVHPEEQPTPFEHFGHDEDDHDWEEVEDDLHHRSKRQSYPRIEYSLPEIPPLKFNPLGLPNYFPSTSTIDFAPKPAGPRLTGNLALDALRIPYTTVNSGIF